MSTSSPGVIARRSGVIARRSGAVCRAVLLAAAAVLSASMIFSSAAGAGAATRRAPSYHAAAQHCAHGHSLKARLNGNSITFLRDRFVPCVLARLRGSRAGTSARVSRQVTHDTAVFVGSRARPTRSAVAEQFGHSGNELCRSGQRNWAWTLADTTQPPALTYIALARQIDAAFFTRGPELGRAADAIFAFSYVRRVFFHDGRARNPLGVAGFVLICP